MVSRPSPHRGPLLAYRIADRRHPLMDGTGARLYGARWNSPGRDVIYASSSYGCAMLERLVHAGIGTLPRNQVSIEIHIPGIVIEELTAGDVPGWDRSDLVAARGAGDFWLTEERSAILLVPSIVARGDKNVLINPAHADFAAITSTEPEPVIWDERLFNR